MSTEALRIRVDKWLWFARFFRTRGKATELVNSGTVRINGTRISKASANIGPGDVLTFPQGKTVRVIRVDAVGTRRGPAPEAQTLYTDLEPPVPPSETAQDERHTAPMDPARREPGAGRPTGKHRREIDALRRLDP